jgi:hypothetical protein
VHLLNPIPIDTYLPTFFSLAFLGYVFGRFSVRGAQKNHAHTHIFPAIKPVRLGDAQLREYFLYASFETRNQIRTPQTELNGVLLCPKLFSFSAGLADVGDFGWYLGPKQGKSKCFQRIREIG